jgi:hypothetical protein
MLGRAGRMVAGILRLGILRLGNRPPPIGTAQFFDLSSCFPEYGSPLWPELTLQRIECTGPQSARESSGRIPEALLRNCTGKTATPSRFCSFLELDGTPVGQISTLTGWFHPRTPGREQVSRFFPGAGEIEERCCLLALAGWFHPLRRSGIMVTRRLFGFGARALMMVAGEGLEPP